MSRFSACTGCALSPATCFTGRRLRKALEGMFVSYVRHRCAERVPLYQPGAAVLIRTRPYQALPPQDGVYIPSEEREAEPPWCEFQGIFIRQRGRLAICYIAKGTQDLDCEWEFYPSTNGFLKIPMSRLKPLPNVPAIDLQECVRCGEYYALTKWCGRENEGWNANHPCIARAT